MGAASSDVSASAEVEDLSPASAVVAGREARYAATAQGGAAAATGRPTESTSSSSRGGPQSDAAQENQAGVKLLNAGQCEEAVRRFKSALAHEPNSVQILNNIGLAYARNQDYVSAYEWYQKAHQLNPQDLETLFSLAWVERKRQRYANAKQLFTEVLDIEPGHTKALWLLADVLQKLNESEGAIRRLEMLIRIQPQSADGHISLAQCMEATKQYTRAAQIYNHVLQNVAPGRPDVHFSLGKVYFLSKQYKQALSQFERVPDNDSRSFEARTYGAKACRELEDHDRAISLAEVAAQSRPHPDVMHFLGEEYLRMGDQQKAAHWFGRGLDLEPNHLPSLLELGQLMYRQSRWQEAEQHFTRICELDRTDLAAVRSLALVKYKLHKDESCRQCCEALLRSEPLHMDALWLLSELQTTGSDDRWFLNLRLPAEVSPADICQSICKGYLTRKQISEAGKWLAKAQHYSPSESRLHEAQQLLSQKGTSVNPQDVINLLDRQEPRSSPTFGRSQNRRRTTELPEPSGAGGYPSGGSADAEDLERLLFRAERAGRLNGPGVISAEQQWKEVLVGAKATLRRKPEDALALRCAARALLSTGGSTAEIKEYARQASEYGDEATGFTLGYELHAFLGSAAEAERNFPEAERHFSGALSSKAGDETAMLGLARVQMQIKERKPQAKKLYEQVVASHPGCAEGYTKLAELALEAEDFSEAHRLATQAVKLVPSDAKAQFCLGQACLKMGRTEEASRALEQASVIQPNATDVPSMLAVAGLHKKAGRDQDAISCYKRVLDLRPGDYECTLSLAQLYAARGAAGASQAVHYFRSSLQCRPSVKESRDIYLQMATVQCAISAWKDAAQTLEGAIKELPDDAEIWRKLLTIYEQQKDSKSQHRCYRHLVQLGAVTSAVHISYSDLLLSEGQIREARDQLNQVLRVEPSNTAALIKLAQSWRQDGSRDSNLEEARRCYEQALQHNPNSAEALEGAAYCHRKSNNLEQAISLYQQCLKVKASAEGPLYYLGDILYRQHRHAECQHYLSRLVETKCADDYKTGALYLLSKSHVSLDEYEEAERHARSGLALKQNHPHFLFILALVKNRMADYDSSISTLKKALQHCDAADSDSLKVEIHDWLAQAYERKGEYTNATAELDRALKHDPNHVSSLITRGLVHIQLQELEQAETSFRKALAVEKTHALALVRLGYCNLLSNDFHEATLLFQRALQQRCGTVALPRSVKGSARIYMALALMSQQDVEGALFQLVEARKSHRNFDELCREGKDGIVKGQCEGLTSKLRKMSDLDVNLSQAWQLVELMAKELELDLREPSAAAGAGKTATPLLKVPQAALQGGPSPAGSPGGKLSPVVEGQGRRWLSAEAGAVPAVPAAAERRAWVAPSPSPPVTAHEAASSPAVAERRQWTTPEVQTPAPDENGKDAKKFTLAKHEQIDFNGLTTNECLGSGGFGAVYRGHFGSKEVAIKKLFCEDGGDIAPLQLEELEKEVGALRSLSHPRLVSFIGACLQPPNLCIVTEFMPGGSLHHLLHKAKTPLTLAQQSKMGLQVCEGVSFLHSSSPPVVHRDLKSLNIVLDRIYNAKICDFGLTQSMDKTHISLKEGGNGGSPRYMAPECYDCKGKITEKVDVWALGCLIVECFGGPLPYDDCSNIQQIVAKVLIDKQLPYIPNHLPKGVRPIVEDCFHFDSKQRTSAQDVYARMTQLNLPAGAA